MVDAIGCVVAFASVIIGAYALLFLLAAARDGNGDVAMQNVVILLAIAVMNAVVEGVRRWRRHHG